MFSQEFNNYSNKIMIVINGKLKNHNFNEEGKNFKTNYIFTKLFYWNKIILLKSSVNILFKNFLLNFKSIIKYKAFSYVNFV